MSAEETESHQLLLTLYLHYSNLVKYSLSPILSTIYL